MIGKKKEDYVEMEHDYKLRCLEGSTYNQKLVDEAQEVDGLSKTSASRFAGWQIVDALEKTVDHTDKNKN
jgi:hypothetical protein